MLDRVEAPDRAEVDEAEGAVGKGEHVSRMRVGVEEADFEHLFEHGAQQLVGERAAVDRQRVELIGIRNRAPFEPFLHDEAPGAELFVDLRDPNHRPPFEHQPHLEHRVDLAPEVELGPQALRELLQHLSRSKTLTEGRAALRNVGDEREHGEVALDDLLDAGPLHLDDDRLPRPQPRAIGLTDRRRGQRLPVELGEDVLDTVAELGFQHRLDLVDRLRGYPVLQSCELGAHLGWQEIDPRGRDLTELDVDATCFLEHAPEPHSDGVDRTIDAVARRRQRPEPFSAGDPRELAVPAEHRDARPDDAKRSRRRDEPGPLTDRERARTGEQVERDRGGHGRRDSDREHVHEEAVGAPFPMREPKGEEGRRAPTEHSRKQCGRPSASHTEQPQRERGRDEGDRCRSDHAQQDHGQDNGDQRSPSLMSPILATRPCNGGRRRRTGAGRCARTVSTSSARPWNASALSASNNNDAVSGLSNSNS